ncbi:MAG: peptidase M2 family protein, partial [Sphingomonadales bacterium]
MIRTGISTLALAAMLAFSPAYAQEAAPTAAEAQAFIDRVQAEYTAFNLNASRVAWINATYITDDTDALAAEYGARGTEMAVKFALEAAKYQKAAGLSAEQQRQLTMLRGAITLPAPTKPGAAQELSEVATKIGSMYGKGKGTLNGKPVNGSDIEAAMGESRNPEELKEMWVSWHDNVGAPMRGDYAKMVGIANEGAKELGFADTGAMWRSNYDMAPADFVKLTDGIWNDLKPLYTALHTYVRAKLNAKYGDAVQAKSGPIRADLLGNMWAQEWGNIYDVVAPPGAGDLGFDVGQLLTAKSYDWKK